MQTCRYSQPGRRRLTCRVPAFRCPTPSILPSPLDVDIQHLPGLFPLVTPHRKLYLQIGSREQPSLRKTRKTELRPSPSRAAIASPLKRFCRRAKISPNVFSVSLLRQRMGVSFGPQAPRRHPAGNDFTIFWRYAGLRQIPLRRQRRAYCPSAPNHFLSLWT